MAQDTTTQSIQYYFALDSEQSAPGCPSIGAPQPCEERSTDANGCPVNVVKYEGENCASQCCQRDGWTPYCVNNTCVQCRSHEDCGEMEGRPLCNEAGFCEECGDKPSLPAGACSLEEKAGDLCPTYTPIYCASDEICVNEKCVTCPAFDASLTENGCRKKKTDENGCPYWEEEPNCVPCEVKTRPQTWTFSTAAVCSWMADHQVENTCSSKGYVRTFSKCQVQYNPGYNQATTHISYKKCPYGFVGQIPYPSLKDFTYTSSYQEQYATGCNTGQVCVDQMCRAKTACGANEIIVNGTCWKCPGQNQTANAAKTACVCKTGYFLNENYACVSCEVSNSTSNGTECMCLPGYQAIYEQIKVSDGSNTSHMEKRLSACQACPPNASSVAGSACQCNPGFQPKYERYQSCAGGVCAQETKLTSCSACPSNASSDGSGVCVCRSGYISNYTEYKSFVGGICGVYKQLQSCTPCSNAVPANATRGNSCNVITCNTGYYATAFARYNYPNSSSYSSVVSKCSPCPANSTGVGGNCTCNSGYKAISKKVPSGTGGTRSVLDRCQKI